MLNTAPLWTGISRNRGPACAGIRSQVQSGVLTVRTPLLSFLGLPFGNGATRLLTAIMLRLLPRSITCWGCPGNLYRASRAMEENLGPCVGSQTIGHYHQYVESDPIFLGGLPRRAKPTFKSNVASISALNFSLPSGVPVCKAHRNSANSSESASRSNRPR